MTRNLTHLVATAVLLVPLATLSAHAPHDVANMVQVSPNFAQDRTVIAVVGLTEHALIAKSTDGGMTWIHMGRAVAENKVTSIDFSPAYATDQTIFIATATKGVYRSTDGGIQWSTTNAGLRSLQVLDLAISPAYATDQTLLAATEAGLFRSGDRGQTWVKTAIGLPNTAVSIVAYGESPLVVFAGTTWLCRSVDGGVTWTPMVNFQRPISSIAVSEHFLSDFTLAVSFGKSEGRGVKVSTDGGTSFFTMLDGLTSPYVNDIAIADNGIFFAVSEEGACYRARNAYGAWTLYNDGFEKMASQTDSHYFSVVVSPSFSQDGTVLVGGHEGLFLSSDHGEHWKQSDLYHQRINRFLEFSPDFASDGELLMGNYGGGPIRFNHTLNSWEALATGLTSLWCGALEFSPTYAIDDTIFYGYYGTWRSTDRGMTWKKIFDPQSVTRAFAISPNFASDGVLFMNVAGGPVNETVKSTDGGDNWTTVSGLPQVRCNHLRISKAYPTDPVVFATPQGQGIYRSNDNGMTWADISGPLTNQNIRSCILSPDFSTDGTLFVGSVGKGLYRSTDRGDNWTMIRGLPSSAIQTIESIGVSPNFAIDQTLFVVSWFDGVYASTDGGNSWQPRNAGLPLDSSRIIRLSPTYASDSTVYITTHAWTYRSQDAGTTWSRLPGFNRIDENHPTVLHHGRWTKEGNGASFGNTLMNSNTGGDVESFEFFGDAITWFARKDSTSGWAEVWLDGVSVGVVDLYSSTPLHSQVAWSKTFSQAGWHQVEISVLGSTSSQSAGTFIRSDGFETRF